MKVAADWVKPMPEVVQAAAEVPTGARVAVPLNVRAVVAPEVAEPRVILVVLPDAPAVPILIVLVLPDAVAPAWMLVVWLAVDRPKVIVPVPETPPAVHVPVL